MIRSDRYELQSVHDRRSKSARGVLLVAGVVLPAICLALSAISEPRPTWQSGELHAYASFLLAGITPLAFWPFVAYSMSCFACALFQRAVARRYLVVRTATWRRPRHTDMRASCAQRPCAPPMEPVVASIRS